MTMATCLRCGASKWGALAPCAACKFLPESSEDKAKSVILSDHHLSVEELRAVGERIRAGQSVEFPADLVAGYKAGVDAGEADFSFRKRPGCAVMLLVVLLVPLSLFGWWVYSLF
jgi:hypothetical protein